MQCYPQQYWEILFCFYLMLTIFVVLNLVGVKHIDFYFVGLGGFVEARACREDFNGRFS